MNHTREPWKLSEVYKDVLGYDGYCIASTCSTKNPIEDANRIVACINFCIGIETQDLLDGKYQLVKKENVL